MEPSSGTRAVSMRRADVTGDFIFWFLDKESDTRALRRTRDEVVQVEVPQCKSIVSVQCLSLATLDTLERP
jgi:hypothetical protein